MKGRISEVFASIQGEGIYCGIRQVFVRFYGCHLECRFCDTKIDKYNLYTAKALITKIRGQGKAHSVSFTGGEPLLQKDFLKIVLPLLKRARFITYLETNGILPDALSEVIADADIVAMDFKLPSSTGMPGFWQEHRKFLKIASRKEVFVKIVVCVSTAKKDLLKAIGIIKSVRKDIVLALQPDTLSLALPLDEGGKGRGEKLINKLVEFQKLGLKGLADVRVIPQMHKYLEIP